MGAKRVPKPLIKQREGRVEQLSMAVTDPISQFLKRPSYFLDIKYREFKLCMTAKRVPEPLIKGWGRLCSLMAVTKGR